MLLEIFILLQIITVIAIILTFVSKSPLVAVISATVSGTLMVGTWVLDVGTQYVWDPSIRAYVRESIIVSTPYIPAFNMMIFGLSILLFFYDMFVTSREESVKIPNMGLGKGQ